MTESLRYKFAELSIVTDETLEEVVNEHVGKGWQLESIHFVSTPASRRPAMAFIAFVQRRSGVEEPSGAPPTERGEAE